MGITLDDTTALNQARENARRIVAMTKPGGPLCGPLNEKTRQALLRSATSLTNAVDKAMGEILNGKDK